MTKGSRWVASGNGMSWCDGGAALSLLSEDAGMCNSSPSCLLCEARSKGAHQLRARKCWSPEERRRHELFLQESGEYIEERPGTAESPLRAKCMVCKYFLLICNLSFHPFDRGFLFVSLFCKGIVFSFDEIQFVWILLLVLSLQTLHLALDLEDFLLFSLKTCIVCTLQGSQWSILRWFLNSRRDLPQGWAFGLCTFNCSSSACWKSSPSLLWLAFARLSKVSPASLCGVDWVSPWIYFGNTPWHWVL